MDNKQQDNNEIIVVDFDTADDFTYKMIQMVDVNKAKSEIKKIIEQIEKDPRLNRELKVGIIEKIKYDLYMDFPFVRRLSETTVEKITGEDLYAEGNEVKLGLFLLESQQDSVCCLDVILEAVRLLNRYDKEQFKNRVVPFMKKHGLESYI